VRRIGIDFGATRVKAGLVDEGRIVRRASAATRADLGREHVLGLVAKLARRVDPDGAANRIGIGFAGMVDARRGVILHTTDTMPPLTNFPLARFAQAETGRQASIDNDGNAHALAEARYGAGIGSKMLVMFTLGTGVGGGIVIGGKVWIGAGAMASHLGHIKVRRGGRRCACGARGCVEAYTAAYAIERASRGRWSSAKEVFAAAQRGDAPAMAIVREAGEALGTACADVTTILNPDVIAIGGGMSKSWSVLEPWISAAFERDALGEARRTTRIVRASLGNDAGIIGASCL
jgi:glucokinase